MTALSSLGQWFGPAGRANPNIGSSVERRSLILPLPESVPPASRAQAPVGVRPTLFRAGLSPARLSTTNWVCVTSVASFRLLRPCVRKVHNTLSKCYTSLYIGTIHRLLSGAGGGRREQGSRRGEKARADAGELVHQRMAGVSREPCTAGRTSTGSRCSQCSGLPVRLGPTTGPKRTVPSGPHVRPTCPTQTSGPHASPKKKHRLPKKHATCALAIPGGKKGIRTPETL